MINCINDFYEKGVVPSNFKKSIIYPLHKKGDVNLVENYRGNTFLDSISKLYTGLLLNRFVNRVETGNILHEWQAGIRPGYSTTDNIFNLANIIDSKFLLLLCPKRVFPLTVP